MTSVPALRSRCRRCQCALPVPAEARRAFCCRGCHRQFYRTKCRVCDEPSPNGRLHASKCSYAHKQNPELYAFKPIQKPSDGGLPKRSRDERNPYKSRVKIRTKSWGPTLSDDEFWLATLPLHFADKANARRAIARAGAEPALGRAKVIFGPETPPLNILGGHRFPSALAIDLAEPQFAPVFDRVPEHLSANATAITVTVPGQAGNTATQINATGYQL